MSAMADYLIDIQDNMFNEYWERLPEEVREAAENCEQNPTYHSEGNIKNHIKLVFIEALQYNDKNLLVAAIFHDLGKIDTHNVREDGRITHYRHEFVSLDYIDKYIHLYDDFNIDEEAIREIVKNHMRCHLYKSGRIKKQGKIEAFENNQYFDLIMKFSDCDERGRG
jgi:CRISPR/Cas system-associated endonuclease Cas3-HD